MPYALSLLFYQFYYDNSSQATIDFLFHHFWICLVTMAMLFNDMGAPILVLDQKYLIMPTTSISEITSCCFAIHAQSLKDSLPDPHHLFLSREESILFRRFIRKHKTLKPNKNGFISYPSLGSRIYNRFQTKTVLWAPQGVHPQFVFWIWVLLTMHNIRWDEHSSFGKAVGYWTLANDHW